MQAWKQYQENAAEYIKSIGLNASTDVTIKGVRTKYDVDVLVTSLVSLRDSAGKSIYAMRLRHLVVCTRSRVKIFKHSFYLEKISCSNHLRKSWK